MSWFMKSSLYNNRVGVHRRKNTKPPGVFFIAHVVFRRDHTHGLDRTFMARIFMAWIKQVNVLG